MAQAAHTKVVSICTTSGGTYAEIDGLSDASLQRAIDMLDTTDLKDTTGERTRIPGLGDASLELSGDYEPSDTNGQTVLRTAAFDKSAVFLKFLSDGTNGKMAQYYVESYDESGAVDGKVAFKASLKKTGAFTAVP